MAISARRQIHLLQRQMEALVARVTELEAENAALRAEVEALRARLGINSQNSSKPPSSDGPEAPKRPPRESSGRSRGGQPGHDKHERSLLPAERVDRTVKHRPAGRCGRCGARVSGAGAEVVRRHQVIELPPVRAVVTEHQLLGVRCGCCGEVQVARLPDSVPRGSFGPRLMAFVAMLVGRFRLSRREAAVLLGEIGDVSMSVGSVAKVCARAGELMDAPVSEVAQVVRGARVANADETGFKCAGEKGWLWCVVVSGATLFHLARSRGKGVIKQLLDGFDGHLGTDRWTSYGWYPDELRQLCWAHLKRNLQGIYERGGFGMGLGSEGGELVKAMFEVWHRYRGSPSRRGLKRAMAPYKRRFRELLEAHRDCEGAKARAFARELLQHWEALWTFLDVPGVEPTNNVAERAIRPAVLWRKGCFGTVSETGVAFVAGILTVSATCKQQQRSLFQYLTALFEAHAAKVPPPKLLAAP